MNIETFYKFYKKQLRLSYSFNFIVLFGYLSFVPYSALFVSVISIFFNIGGLAIVFAAPVCFIRNIILMFITLIIIFLEKFFSVHIKNNKFLENKSFIIYQVIGFLGFILEIISTIFLSYYFYETIKYR